MCSSKFDPSLWLRNRSPIKRGKVHNIHGCKWQSQGWKLCFSALHLVRLVCKAANPEKKRQWKHQQMPWAGKYEHWVSRLWAWTTVFRFGILIYQPLAALKPSSLFTSSRTVPTWPSWCCPHPATALAQPPRNPSLLAHAMITARASASEPPCSPGILVWWLLWFFFLSIQSLLEFHLVTKLLIALHKRGQLPSSPLLSLYHGFFYTILRHPLNSY